jgi:glycosyltransferase involved in cell wall biosynthesis
MLLTRLNLLTNPTNSINLLNLLNLLYIHIYILYVYILHVCTYYIYYMYVCIHIYTYIHICIYACVCVCVCVCMYICMYTYRKFGLNKPFLLCVGKRYGYKNYDILWQGLALMPKSFRGMNFKIYMKGKGLKKQKSENMKIKCLKDKKKRTRKLACPSCPKTFPGKKNENERKRPHAPC